MPESEQPTERLTKEEALLEALRLLLANDLVDVRGVTVYLTAKRPKTTGSSEQSPDDRDRE